MPVYEYECSECGTAFEKRMSFSEADLKPECPKCGSQQTNKKISVIGSIGGALSGSSAGSTGNCGSRGGFS